jgi:hypothetical protein
MLGARAFSKGVNMPIQEIVEIVGTYLGDGGATLERRDGSQAVMVAQDLAALLKAGLQEESVYASLWDQFEAEPQQTATELAGALEALIEADPALARRMEAFLEEYHRAAAHIPTEEGVSEEEALEEQALEQEAAGATQPEGGPYQPVDSPGDYNESGTYLYGNLRPGVDSLDELGEEEEVPVEDVDEMAVEDVDEMIAPDVSQVVSLFQGLYAIVEGYQGLDPATRQSLRAELEQMATDVAEGRDEYEVFISTHLCAIEDLNPEIYRLVIERLAGPEADFAPVVQRVARGM